MAHGSCSFLEKKEQALVLGILQNLGWRKNMDLLQLIDFKTFFLSFRIKSVDISVCACCGDYFVVIFIFGSFRLILLDDISYE